ncbi:MAG: hypothetical protein ACO2YV_11670, partial [Pseudomonadales bacterium]
ECDGDGEEDGPSRQLVKATKVLRDAWHSTGEEILDGQPYITRSALLSFILDNKILRTEGSAKKHLQPSFDRGYIGPLIDENIIEEAPNGFAFIDQIMVSQMKVGKDSDGTNGTERNKTEHVPVDKTAGKRNGTEHTL